MAIPTAPPPPAPNIYIFFNIAVVLVNIFKYVNVVYIDISFSSVISTNIYQFCMKPIICCMTNFDSLCFILNLLNKNSFL